MTCSRSACPRTRRGSRTSRSCPRDRRRRCRFPTTSTRGCGRRWSARGITGCTRTRREVWDRSRTGRARRRRHRHGQRQDARLRAAGDRSAAGGSPRPRPLPLADEGAGPGPGAHAAVAAPGARPAAGAVRRRHRPGRPRDGAPAREPAADQPRHAARRHLPARRPLGRRAREPDARRDRRGARLPRRLRLARRQRAAAAAPGLRGGRLVAAVPARLGDDREPGRDDDRADRRSRSRSSAVDGAPQPEREIALWNPTLLDPETRRARLAAGRGGGADRRARAARPARDLLRAQSRRVVEVVHRVARETSRCGRRTCATRSRPTGPATRPSSAASSSGGCRRASCGRSSPPTRWSSASTSGCSTARSSSASPAPWPACASAGAAPAAAAPASRAGGVGRRARPVPHPAPGAAHRPAGGGRDPRRTRAPRSAGCTWPAPRTRRRSPRRTTPSSAAAPTPRPCGWPSRATCASRRRASPGAAASSRPGTSPLRSSSGAIVAIVDTDTGQVLGTVEAGARVPHRPRRAPSTCTWASQYHVRELDLDERVAESQPFAGDWYTQVQSSTMTDITRTRTSAASARASTWRSARWR